MDRTLLTEKLRRYGDRFPGEAATVERFIAFVSENEDCFKRSLAEGHVTGSAWVVDQGGTKVLLTHHRKLDRWLQLGGHADGNPDILAVALREIEEESGLTHVEPLGGEIFDVDIHLIPERGTEGAHFHYDVRFAVRNLGDESYVVSDESHDLGWITIENLDEVTVEESMLRMARKWASFKTATDPAGA